MSNHETMRELKKEKFNEIETILKKVAELSAFIKTYGYGYYYNNEGYIDLIIVLNNISEHYLQDPNFDSKAIDNLYDIYSTAKEENKSEKEIFDKLTVELCEKPTQPIMREIRGRSLRRRTYL